MAPGAMSGRIDNTLRLEARRRVRAQWLGSAPRRRPGDRPRLYSPGYHCCAQSCPAGRGRPTVARCALALATARFGRPGGLARSLLKPIKRPPLPALGHSRHREQPLDFIPVTGVDAKHVLDAETTS